MLLSASFGDRALPKLKKYVSNNNLLRPLLYDHVCIIIIQYIFMSKHVHHKKTHFPEITKHLLRVKIDSPGIRTSILLNDHII